MFRITLDEFTLSISESLPTIFSEYREHAKLVEIFESRDTDVSQVFLAVAKNANWPFLIVVQKRSTGAESGFHPGMLLIPETHLLFVGVEEHVFVYNLETVERMWEEQILLGFWGWERYGHYVIMSAEVEMAVWDMYGKKLWSTFVEPPWSYTLDDDSVYLDVGEKKFSFSLLTGPTAPTW